MSDDFQERMNAFNENIEILREIVTQKPKKAMEILTSSVETVKALCTEYKMKTDFIISINYAELLAFRFMINRIIQWDIENNKIIMDNKYRKDYLNLLDDEVDLLSSLAVLERKRNGNLDKYLDSMLYREPLKMSNLRITNCMFDIEVPTTPLTREDVEKDLSLKRRD